MVQFEFIYMVTEILVDQWCSSKFGAGGMLGGLGAEPPAGFRGRAPGRGSGAKPLKLKAFLFLDIPREGPFFTSSQNFVNFVNHTYFKLHQTDRT